MDLIIWLILWGLIVLALLVGVVLVVVLAARGKRREKETDYRVFFTLGICYFPLGIAWFFIESLRPLGIVFLSLGAIYLLIGLANKDKWAKSQKET